MMAVMTEAMVVVVMVMVVAVVIFRWVIITVGRVDFMGVVVTTDRGGLRDCEGGCRH